MNYRCGHDLKLKMRIKRLADYFPAPFPSLVYLQLSNVEDLTYASENVIVKT